MGAQYSATTGKVTLGSGSVQTILLLNPVSNQAVITEVSISLDAASAAAGVQFDLYRVNSLGSPAGTSASVIATNPTTQAATTTAIKSLTVEPSSVFVLDSWFLQPIGGLFVLQYPLGREPLMATAGARYGIRYTSPTSVTPDCVCTVWFEE